MRVPTTYVSIAFRRICPPLKKAILWRYAHHCQTLSTYLETILGGVEINFTIKYSSTVETYTCLEFCSLEGHCRESPPEDHLQSRLSFSKHKLWSIVFTHCSSFERAQKKIKVIIFLLQEPQWQERDQLISNCSFQELNLDVNEV